MTYKGGIFNNYNEYIHSSMWKEKRDEVLTLKPKCESCGKKAQLVHHKTYEHIENEPLKDLQPLCFKCHTELHKRCFIDDDGKVTERPV